MILKKDQSEVIMTGILVTIFQRNCDEFPVRFDQFAKSIVTELYKRFRYIESNPIVFEREMNLLTGFEASNLIELAE
jgi:hypothetical protein